jgi:D-beta-D-heptose 7-phosphate kinase/D-beta-D-heptose 1-phosphate adenosyltransferase
MNTKNKKLHNVDIEKILSRHPHAEDRYVSDYKELKCVVDELKERGLRVVLTQGVFDLLHEGHAKYLEKALSYGDVLIVGVDTDELTRQRKGPNRPVVPFEERVRMLAHLRHVTIITKRDVGMKSGSLIETICPHVLVTSFSTKDFSKKDASEYKVFCEKVITLPQQAPTNTTARIHFFTIEGADALARELADKLPKVVLKTFNNMRKM